MSVRISSLVWEFSQQSGSDLVMLLAIADFASDDGTAYPSIATLARKTRMQVRNARYILSRLAESGELTIKPNAGPKGCNVFRVTIKQPLQNFAPLQSSAPLQAVAATPAKPCTKPLQRIAPEPSLNRQEPSLKTLSGKPDLLSPSREVLAYLNNRVGRNYRAVETNLSLIRARLQSGASIAECRQVIDAKVREWAGDSKMGQYLRPSTLFAARNFEQYLGALGSKQAAPSTPEWVRAGFGSADEAARAMEHA